MSPDDQPTPRETVASALRRRRLDGASPELSEWAAARPGVRLEYRRDADAAITALLDHDRIAHELRAIGAINRNKPTDAQPWVNAPLSIVLDVIRGQRTPVPDPPESDTL